MFFLYSKQSTVCTLFTLNTTRAGIASLPEDSGYKCLSPSSWDHLPLQVPLLHPFHPMFPKMRIITQLIFIIRSDIALTHLILTKEYKVKLSRKEGEETTVQRLMEYSWLTYLSSASRGQDASLWPAPLTTVPLRYSEGVRHFLSSIPVNLLNSLDVGASAKFYCFFVAHSVSSLSSAWAPMPCLPQALKDLSRSATAK